MQPIEDFQIRYTNTDAIEDDLLESMQNSNIFKTNMDVYQKMTLVNFKTYKSILPRVITKPDSSNHFVNY
jgi:hypothetical protein